MPRRTAKIDRSNETSTQDADIEIEPVVDDNQEDENKEVTMFDLDDLSNLVFLGRLSEIIDVSGYKFVITTLSTGQQREIMQTVMKFDQLDRLLDIKPVTVSYAIESINGVSLEKLCKDDSIENINERRMNVVLSLQSSIIERAYQVYETLVTTSNKEIGLEDLKD